MCLYRIFSVGNICCSQFWFLTFSLDILIRKIYVLRFYRFYVSMYVVVQNRKILTFEFSNTNLGDVHFWALKISIESTNWDAIFEVPNNTNFALNESIDYQEIIKSLTFELTSNLLNAYENSLITSEILYEMRCAIWYYFYN